MTERYLLLGPLRTGKVFVGYHDANEVFLYCYTQHGIGWCSLDVSY